MYVRRGVHAVAVLADRTFARSTIGCHSNSWASCFSYYNNGTL